MVFVCGLGGGTNSGKTTLCQQLAAHYPNCYIFNQDKYFKTLEEATLSFGDSEVNWETTQALKMDLLTADVKKEMQNGHDVIIVEGHLVLNHPPLVELYNGTVFITLPYDLARTRRLTRTYDPADYPGYFENVVWPGYLLIVEEVKENEKLGKTLWLDATDPEKCFTEVEHLVIAGIFEC